MYGLVINTSNDLLPHLQMFFIVTLKVVNI